MGKHKTMTNKRIHLLLPMKSRRNKKRKNLHSTLSCSKFQIWKRKNRQKKKPMNPHRMKMKSLLNNLVLDDKISPLVRQGKKPGKKRKKVKKKMIKSLLKK